MAKEDEQVRFCFVNGGLNERPSRIGCVEVAKIDGGEVLKYRGEHLGDRPGIEAAQCGVYWIRNAAERADTGLVGRSYWGTIDHARKGAITKEVRIGLGVSGFQDGHFPWHVGQQCTRCGVRGELDCSVCVEHLPAQPSTRKKKTVQHRRDPTDSILEDIPSDEILQTSF